MKQFIGYSQKSEVKVLRTTHQVGLREGLLASELRIFLQRVPPEARIIEIDPGDSEMGDLPYLLFEVEKAETSTTRADADQTKQTFP
jgi:hypothetical protein